VGAVASIVIDASSFGEKIPALLLRSCVEHSLAIPVTSPCAGSLAGAHTRMGISNTTGLGVYGCFSRGESPSDLSLSYERRDVFRQSGTVEKWSGNSGKTSIYTVSLSR
jgi:hypothetical protein